jgi:hypothetical protein
MSKGKIFNAQKEKIKLNFEIEFKKLFNSELVDKHGDKALTWGFKLNNYQMTIDELNEILQECFMATLKKHQEVKEFSPKFIFEEDKKNVRVVYEK